MNDPTARIVLLVEDSEADAELVADYLSPDRGDNYEVHQVSLLADALEMLTELEVDVVLLDLHLPDSVAVEGVSRIRQRIGEIPIIVLTGLGEQDLALRCITAGAQDYLVKDGLKPAALRRAIDYAVARQREAELRTLRRTLARYKKLASEGSVTSVTAANAGVGPLRERLPAEFEDCVGRYSRLLWSYVARDGRSSELNVRNAMQILVTRIGDGGGGPKDVIDIHTRVLEEIGKSMSSREHHALIIDGRLFVIEMIGLLVEYYRIGRRYYFDGDSI